MATIQERLAKMRQDTTGQQNTASVSAGNDISRRLDAMRRDLQRDNTVTAAPTQQAVTTPRTTATSPDFMSEYAREMARQAVEQEMKTGVSKVAPGIPGGGGRGTPERGVSGIPTSLYANAYTPDPGLYLTEEGRKIAGEMQSQADKAYSGKSVYEHAQEAANAELEAQRKKTNEAMRTANAFLPLEAAPADAYDDYFRLYDEAADEEKKLHDLGGRSARELPQTVGESFGAGVVGAARGLVNMAGYIGQRGTEAQMEENAEMWRRAGREDYAADMEEIRDSIAPDKYESWADFGQDYIQRAAEHAAGQGKVGKAIAATAQGVGGMVPSIVSNLIVPGSGLWVMFAQASGNATEEALQNGASKENALLYGTAVGGIEVLTEKMFGGIPGLGVGALDEGIENLVKSQIGSEAAQRAVLFFIDALGEGAEEFTSEFCDWLMDKWLVGADQRSFAEVNHDALYSALIGALTSMAMSAPANLFKSSDGRKELARQLADQVGAEISDNPNNTTVNQYADGEAAAGRMSETGADTLRRFYDGAQDPVSYMQDMMAAYNAGVNGAALSAVSSTVLNDAQKQAAYLAGQAAQAQVQAADTSAAEKPLQGEQKAPAQAFQPGLNMETVEDVKLTRRETRTLDALGKVLGVEVRMVDAVTDKDGKQSAGQGKYQNGVIEISKSAKDPVVTVAVHEAVHRVRELSPEAYDSLRDYVQRKLGDEKLAKSEALRSLAYDENTDLTEEVVADAFGVALSDENFIKGFVQEDRNVAQKFFDALNDMIVKVRRMLTGQNVQLSQEQRAEFAELARKLDVAQSLFSEALKTAEQAVGANNYSGNSLTENKEIYSYQFLTAQKPMKTTELPSIDTIRNSDGKVDQAAVIDAGMKNARAVGTERDGKVYVENDYTGRDLRVDVSSIRHGLNGKANRLLTNARLGAVIGDIVKRAIPINALNNEADGVRGTYAMAAYAYDDKGREYIAVVTVEQRTNSVDGVEVYDVAHAVSGRQKTGSQADTKSQGVYPIKAATISIAQLLDTVNSTHQSILSDDVLTHYGETRDPKGTYAGKAKYSVSSKDLIQRDTQGHEITPEQQEFFRESKVRDDHGRLKVMYHGTSNAGFNTFDRYFNKFGLFGNGYYFTDNREVAEGYSKKGRGNNPGIYEVYLNITNPIDMDAEADIDAWIKAFEDFDLDPAYLAERTTNEDAFRALIENLQDEGVYQYDGEDTVDEMLRSMGYDGITHRGGGRYGAKNGPEHRVYIAFDQEQIKRTDNSSPTENPDTRYSISSKDLLKQYAEQYGAIKQGENPVRDVTMPKRTTPKTKVSMTARTVMEAGATPESMMPTLEHMAAEHEFDYTPYSDEKAIKNADSFIAGKGYQTALTDWVKEVSGGNVSKTNTAIGWALYNNAANSGDTETALIVLRNIVQHQRNAAQAVQATRILKKLNPETQLYNAEKTVESLQEELKKRYKDQAPDLEIDPDLAEMFLRAKTQEDRDRIMQKIYRDIGRQMPTRFVDRWNAWRYLAMLGNPRTHVRNVAGNLGFAPVVFAKDMTATAIESAVNLVSGGKIARTKGSVIGKGDLLKAAWNDYANIESEALGEGKYSDKAAANKEIQEGRRIFGNTRSQAWNKTGGAALEGFRKANSWALDKEDVLFSKPHYAFALAQYCAANGITAAQIAKGEGLAEARAYAIKEAQKATYRDTNDFSQAISRLGRGAQWQNNKASRAVSTIIEGILPFRKTPANILARGVEYSPIGLLKSLTADMVQLKKGEITAADLIDNISSGLTGTGLMMLGYFLASQGLLRGRGGDDEKKKKFDDLTGHQNYAIEMPDGTSITLDWLAPEVLPLFIGTNLYELRQDNGENIKMADVLSAIGNVSEPLLEMSCLQSLNDVFDAVGYAKEGDLNALTSVVTSAATSYLTQALPTLLGQMERSGEDKRMTTYTDKNGFLTGNMQYTIGKASAKIPGFDYHQIPYIDAWGREERTGKFLERIGNNFFNPSFVSKVNENDMEKELLRLNDVTGDSGVFPQRAVKYFNVNGERKDLTGDEYVQYATEKGRTSYTIVGGMVQSDLYKDMTDTEKAAAVKDAYDYANQTAKSLFGAEPLSWVREAQTGVTRGIPVENYIIVKNAVSEISGLKDESGETIKNSKGLQIMEKIYSIPGLTDSQRNYLFECFDVGKTIIGYNKAKVTEELKKMREKTK